MGIHPSKKKKRFMNHVFFLKSRNVKFDVIRSMEIYILSQTREYSY